MQQFETLNRQQQPYIQSGYGAMGKLNTLLGLGMRPIAAPTGGAGSAPGQQFQPLPGGGVRRIASTLLQPPKRPLPVMGGGSRLNQILALRAANGDSEAARILGGI